ncbi:N-acetylglucosamine-6-phosphate deacetylase [Kosmotoga arenicorallina S304]|uniref:N-acetylglucosamine-6-phosphate deacetylase n=1 Tax=Kosmotoga arenicorallina S304 TaxID=1453497 RepID=A0A176K4N6_9BACT|nr:N-acetylglucosamine-6-phosphate deacetylase [Kosmotoga arenicorallina]OAA32532.1 N-acetylglucosamine-6-phosphate deacetylase [Kosmotoga arenicorallina S304]
MKLENILIVDPVDGEYTGSINIEDEEIVDIRRLECTPKAIVMPGFVDPHTHGQRGIDTMSAKPRDFEVWAELNFQQGVTSFLPTTVSSSFEALRKVLFNLQELPLSIVGVHLEGPFINPEKKGAQNPDFIYPFDERLESVLKNPVKLITAAPEIDGFKKLLELSESRKIKVSIGHSSATYKAMKTAFESGADRITHFPNALVPIHHRELGGMGSGLYLDFKLELIADGVHLAPEFVDLVYRIKGPDKIMLVTDSISAAGLEDGIYDLGGLDVEVRDGKCRLARDGSIAGSSLLFNNAVKNFKKFTGCNLMELSKVSSYNSIRELGIEKLGRIARGYFANLVVLDESLTVLKTFFKGIEVYKRF